MLDAPIPGITREENDDVASTEVGLQNAIRTLPLLDSGVLITFLVQLIGYGTLLAIYPHSELSPIVELLQRIPASFLIPFALFGVPAAVVASILGTPLTIVGLSPGSIPAILFARGDLIVFVSAYGLSVVSVWAYRRQWR